MAHAAPGYLLLRKLPLDSVISVATDYLPTPTMPTIHAAPLQEFATRLLASGAPDPSFAADVVADTMEVATAIAYGSDDTVVVAGRGDPGVPGAVIVRLQADGELDALFGHAGSTWIDLPSDGDPFPEIHDMAVLEDRRVLAAGGSYGNRTPFVIRLLGDAGGVVDVILPDSSAVRRGRSYYRRTAHSVRNQPLQAGFQYGLLGTIDCPPCGWFSSLLLTGLEFRG